MAVARRVAQAPPPPAGGSVTFGNDGFFTGGLGLPEGNYACSFSPQMFQPTKADGTPSRTAAFLAVMMTAIPIDPQSGQAIGEAHEVPLNCGTSAHESFVPSVDGKGFDAVPNGKSSGMWNLSPFGIFFDSLKNAGLPPGLITNSFEPLDGIWIHTQNIPEPEEKKAFARRAKAKTGAAAMQGGGAEEEDNKNRTVTVVTEILEGGKPWEGTGGIPDGSEAPAPRAAAKVTTMAPRQTNRTAPAPVAAPAADVNDEEAVGNAALESVSDVLGENPGGMMKIALKTQAFAACKKKFGDEMAQLVQGNYIKDDATLAAVVDELGYSFQGLKVVPKA